MQGTFILDRRTFEEFGYATRCGRSWDNTFYRSPEVFFARLGEHNNPPWLELLDLTEDCTEEDIKKAYLKMARIAHPDAGGSSEDFKRIRGAYEQAMEAVRSKA